LFGWIEIIGIGGWREGEGSVREKRLEVWQSRTQIDCQLNFQVISSIPVLIFPFRHCFPSQQTPSSSHPQPQPLLFSYFFRTYAHMCSENHPTLRTEQTHQSTTYPRKNSPVRGYSKNFFRNLFKLPFDSTHLLSMLCEFTQKPRSVLLSDK
jgi:hypothetical protein